MVFKVVQIYIFDKDNHPLTKYLYQEITSDVTNNTLGTPSQEDCPWMIILDSLVETCL